MMHDWLSKLKPTMSMIGSVVVFCLLETIDKPMDLYQSNYNQNNVLRTNKIGKAQAGDAALKINNLQASNNLY